MTLEHIHSKNHLALISLMCTYSINQINYADYKKSLYLPLVEEKKKHEFDFDTASDTFLRILLANYFLSNFERVYNVSNKAVVTKLTKL